MDISYFKWLLLAPLLIGLQSSTANNASNNASTYRGAFYRQQHLTWFQGRSLQMTPFFESHLKNYSFIISSARHPEQCISSILFNDSNKIDFR
ncbi:unnamed protein product [Gordionus sp. m RMFG-2023]